MLATARTPPMCLTKMSLDTLKKSEDSLIFQQLPNKHQDSTTHLKVKLYPKNSSCNTASK